MKEIKKCSICGSTIKVCNTEVKARLEAEIKYFGEYKSKVLNNEIN